jgi:hypothetical protein
MKWRTSLRVWSGPVSAGDSFGDGAGVAFLLELSADIGDGIRAALDSGDPASDSDGSADVEGWRVWPELSWITMARMMAATPPIFTSEESARRPIHTMTPPARPTTSPMMFMSMASP